MKKTTLFVTLLAALLAAVAPASCTHDNEEELFGATVCDSTEARYSVQVLAILQDNCYTCHQPGRPQFNGFSLASFNALKGYANSGQLLNRTNNAGSPMPPSGLLSECDRQALRSWVEAGAKDN
jgi:mono/diheme cytochrome c family protein